MGMLQVGMLVTLFLNAMMLMGQISMNHINPENPTMILSDLADNPLCGHDNINCDNGSVSVVVNDGFVGNIPQESSQDLLSQAGQLIANIFSTVRNWIVDTTSAGFKYAKMVLYTPSNYLSALGMPSDMSGVIGAVWYLWTLFIVVAWYKGEWS